MRDVTTAAIVFGDRYIPPAATRAQAEGLLASGVVDTVVVPDQLNNFIPPSLWTAENTPLAAILPDCDSAADAFATAAYLAGAIPGIDLTLTTDGIRRTPAELIQTMLTLANMTEGRVRFQIGGGEQKQCRPYGHKRGQGLARMEDLLEIYARTWASTDPITYEGHHSAFTRASLGGARTHRPSLWALGGGPRLLDLATSHCDGFAAAAPCVWASPSQAAAHIEELEATLAEKGRDRASFHFGIYCPVLMHEDAEVLARATRNPMVRWMAGVYGRIDPADWADVDLPSPVPDGWTYYMKMVPQHETPDFIEHVLAATTEEHVRRGFLVGTPAEVAATLGAYVDAGVDWVLPLDYMALLLGPEAAPALLARTIETLARVKRHTTGG